MNYLDWSIVATYLLLVLSIGLYSSRGISQVVDYFLAGRRLGVGLVAISVIATETSAATVIGGPDTAYRADLAYLQTTIGAVLSRLFLAYYFIDVFYKHRVYTVYGFLANRFGGVVQRFTAVFFCFARLGASGARLYIASYAISTISSIDLFSCLVIISLIAVIYGVAGGLKSVVVTDLIQGVLFLAAAVYSLFLVSGSLGGFSELYSVVSSSNKMRIFDFSFDIFSVEFWKNPYTFIGAVLGGFTLGVATHGTDQDMVQRLLACKDSRDGRRSLVLAGLIEIPVALLFTSLGLALWAFYQKAGATAPPATESVFPYFILNDLPMGLRGLLFSAILAAAMSSLDSALTALASVTLADIYLPFKKMSLSDSKADSSKILNLSRLFSALWGVLLFLTALSIAYYHRGTLEAVASGGSDITRNAELLTLALGVMSVLYGPLLGVFLLGIFSRRGSTKSVLLGMLSGLLLTICVRYSDSLGWTWHIVIGTIATVVTGALGKPSARIEGELE